MERRPVQERTGRHVKDYSQHGETAILRSIFDRIGTRIRYAVEFGAGDGWRHSNIRGLLEDGWSGVQWDKDVWVTAENVNRLFADYEVPKTVDLVSIDIDGNDYWVWKALRWQPQVVIIEYNAYFGHGVSVALEYNPQYEWNRTYGYSASLDAMCDLAESKGYVLVEEVASANLIFALADLGLPELDREAVNLGWDHWHRRTPDDADVWFVKV